MRVARELERERERGEIMSWSITDFGPFHIDVSVMMFAPVKYTFGDIKITADGKIELP